MKIFFPPSAAAAWASAHLVCQWIVPWSLKCGWAWGSLMSLIFGPTLPGSARFLETTLLSAEDPWETTLMPHLQRLLLFALALAAACGDTEPEVGRIPGRPDIVLVTVDTLRADHLGCYGFPHDVSPNIDDFARRAVRFENVIAPVPLTLPSHSSMLTGTNPPFHGAHANIDYRLDDAANVTLAEIFEEHGFATAAVVSTVVLDSGLGLDQGFVLYDDDFGDFRGVAEVGRRPGAEASDRRAEVSSRAAMRWLERHRDERFFLFLHYYDPHAPYEAPAPFAARFPDNPYAAEIAYTDHWVGRVLGKLKELALDDSTLVIITSDHGESLGEHGEPFHDFLIYQGVLRVPLIIRLPGRGEGAVVVKELVGLVDIVPTVCGLLGFELPVDRHGIDLSAHLRGAAPPGSDRTIYSECMTATKYDANPLLGVVSSDGWKYIHTTRPELYDLTRDPGELHNRIEIDPDRGRALQDRLKNILAEQARNLLEHGTVTDPQTRKRIESLAYAGGVRRTLEVEQARADPKDLIRLHVAYFALIDLVEAGKLEEAQRVAEEILQARPSFPGGHKYMARILLDQGDAAAAVRHLKRALEFEPDHARTHNNLGVAYQSLKQLDAAVRHFREAVRLDPELAEARLGLGLTLSEAGLTAEAVGVLRQAVESRPDRVDALNALAWILATSPDGAGDASEALAAAEKAVALTGRRDPSILDTLAAACAVAGRFDRAVAEAKSAAELAASGGREELAAEIRARLELYARHEPYRAPRGGH